MERLQKILANAGIASRRAGAELIKEGCVTVDGRIVLEPGARFDPSQCEIKVDGKPVKIHDKKIYIMLNKPQGYISTARDPRGRKTVLDLVPNVGARLFPVGRLDRDTEGLLLLTNDGHAAYTLTHPKFEIYKTYLAVVEGVPAEEKLSLLRKGIRLQSGHVSSPAQVRIVTVSPDSAVAEIKIREGRKRQVREMFDFIGHPVRSLVRTHLGRLELGDLKPGSWRYLTKAEENWIREMSAGSQERPSK